MTKHTKNNKMTSILRSILEMPYYKNYAATSGKVHNTAKHEDAIESVIMNYGLKKASRKVPQKLRDEWVSDPYSEREDMEEGTYISQPCGSHQSPDFFVKIDGRKFALECKSSKTPSPMYNSGIPKSGYIYVFTSKKYNKTTCFLGQHILSKEEKKLIDEHVEEARERDLELRSKLENSHGIHYYTRPMIIHGGDKEMTDYFLNENKEILEKRVLEWV